MLRLTGATLPSPRTTLQGEKHAAHRRRTRHRKHRGPRRRAQGDAEPVAAALRRGPPSTWSPGVVTAAIRTLWHDCHFKNREVHLGVGSGSVLVRQLELDWMPPADLRKALRYQVADLPPVSVVAATIKQNTLD